MPYTACIRWWISIDRQPFVPENWITARWSWMDVEYDAPYFLHRHVTVLNSSTSVRCNSRLIVQLYWNHGITWHNARDWHAPDRFLLNHPHNIDKWILLTNQKYKFSWNFEKQGSTHGDTWHGPHNIFVRFSICLVIHCRNFIFFCFVFTEKCFPTSWRHTSVTPVMPLLFQEKTGVPLRMREENPSTSCRDRHRLNVSWSFVKTPND